MVKEQKIKDTLMNMGISPKYNGFSYLTAAVGMCCKDATIRCDPVGQLYRAVAQDMTNGEEKLVLQSIRRALFLAWKEPSLYREQVFKYRTDNQKAPPPLEFIARVSDILTEQEGVENGE